MELCWVMLLCVIDYIVNFVSLIICVAILYVVWKFVQPPGDSEGVFGSQLRVLQTIFSMQQSNGKLEAEQKTRVRSDFSTNLGRFERKFSIRWTDCDALFISDQLTFSLTPSWSLKVNYNTFFMSTSGTKYREPLCVRAHVCVCIVYCKLFCRMVPVIYTLKR